MSKISVIFSFNSFLTAVFAKWLISIWLTLSGPIAKLRLDLNQIYGPTCDSLQVLTSLRGGAQSGVTQRFITNLILEISHTWKSSCSSDLLFFYLCSAQQKLLQHIHGWSSVGCPVAVQAFIEDLDVETWNVMAFLYAHCLIVMHIVAPPLVALRES